jgi:hypothetical protein
MGDAEKVKGFLCWHRAIVRSLLMFLALNLILAKAKPATTVTAPDVIVSKGTGVVIQCTVLYISSPAKHACISKNSWSCKWTQLPLSWDK